jgi:hypothetical protein
MTIGTGRYLGDTSSTQLSKFIPYNYIATVVTQSIFTAPFPCIVTGIQGRPRVAGSDGSAVTFSFYKAPSGTAGASGTLLHDGTYNLKGTADTNQTLTLVTDTSSLTLAAGDSISCVLTGTATAAIGNITVTVEPLA